jgi:hypothetical protein
MLASLLTTCPKILPSNFHAGLSASATRSLSGTVKPGRMERDMMIARRIRQPLG